MKKPKLTPVEYAIEGHPEVYVRKAPEFKSPIDNRTKPAFWYVATKVTRCYWDELSNVWVREKVAMYWASGWLWKDRLPCQFSTPEEAAADFLSAPIAPPEQTDPRSNDNNGKSMEEKSTGQAIKRGRGTRRKSVSR